MSAAADTSNVSAEEATPNVPAASDTKNYPEAEATEDAPAAEDTSNTLAAETSRLCFRFSYSKKILMVDKESFWHHNEKIPSNVIGMFEDDLMYGRVVSVTRPYIRSSSS